MPRTNRGIFAINELPDLAERIQVGLLNVLEERDVQIRGYKIRLPLDVILVASANPEDYTNRGRIITPLKDRFGSQIRTHYPLEVETEIEIMRQEARPPSIGDVTVTMPGFVEEVIAEFSQQARGSSNVNQRSGVSVRLSVSNYESVCANAVRRALRLGERDVAPRISDVIEAIPASSGGKIEIESLEEGREGLILAQLVQRSVLDVYRRRNLGDKVRDIIAAFDAGAISHTGSDIASADLARMMADIPSLRVPVLELTGGNESPAVVASAIEFILDSLHLNKRINRDRSAGRSTYRSRA
ncbi:MAG: hypothetical protein ACKO04_03485 [Actinomycetes bacterium]